MRYDRKAKTLTISQQHLEAWINSTESMGEFLALLGVPAEEIEQGNQELEDFRVKIDSDPTFAAKVEAEGYEFPSGKYVSADELRKIAEEADAS